MVESSVIVDGCFSFFFCRLQIELFGIAFYIWHFFLSQHAMHSIRLKQPSRLAREKKVERKANQINSDFEQKMYSIAPNYTPITS